MTSRQRNKGNAAEREVSHLLAELTGWRVRRRLQEGRTDDTGDLEGVPDTCLQVKNYADVLRAIREGLGDRLHRARMMRDKLISDESAKRVRSLEDGGSQAQKLGSGESGEVPGLNPPPPPHSGGGPLGE